MAIVAFKVQVRLSLGFYACRTHPPDELPLPDVGAKRRHLSAIHMPVEGGRPVGVRDNDRLAVAFNVSVKNDPPCFTRYYWSAELRRNVHPSVLLSPPFSHRAVPTVPLAEPIIVGEIAFAHGHQVATPYDGRTNVVELAANLYDWAAGTQKHSMLIREAQKEVKVCFAKLDVLKRLALCRRPHETCAHVCHHVAQRAGRIG